MILMEWHWAYVFLLPVTFFLWAAIHELLHVAAAALHPGIEWWRIKLWPHTVTTTQGQKLRWAAVQYQPKRHLTLEDRGRIAAAPLLGDAIGAMLLLVLSSYPVAVVVLGGCLVDAAVLLSGRDPMTDGGKLREALGGKFTWARVIGYAMIGLIAMLVILKQIFPGGV